MTHRAVSEDLDEEEKARIPDALDNIAIRVSNLGKCYQIYDTPRDRLKQFIAPRFKRLVGRMSKQYFREFWALKDISFEVKKGETIGIIGCNGSGKSTLLQLICGTLTSTIGGVHVNGRVAALLELGAGFNPEFTGRENVYMNASILGLTNKEIDQKFDGIVAFADISEFINQPVKTYSSGMYLRLAFAVMAHVDADILVIDEALSVGDAVFTQKCMRFIRDFQERGTLLFVSHDMGSVLNLCKTSIWIDHGVIQKVGSSKEVSESYLQYTMQEIYGEEINLSATKVQEGENLDGQVQSPPNKRETLPLLDYKARATVQDNLQHATGWKTGSAELVSIHLDQLDVSSEGVFIGGEKVRVTIRAKALEVLDSPILGFLVRDRLGQDLFGENTLPFTSLNKKMILAGQEFKGEFVFRLPMLPNGHYAVMASVADGDLCNNTQHHYLHDALNFTVSSSKVRWGLVGIPFENVVLKVLD